MKTIMGKRLGKYQILGEIGRGGMAVVYKALDTTLDRVVALKVLAPHLTWEPGFIARFRREAKTAANLNHPNIVTIYEIGQAEDSHYIAMQYIAGPTLKEIIDREGALPVATAVNIVNQLASALDYAHSQGVVHRDIKPSNVIVDAKGHVTLTDFGIVKAADGTRLTTTGATLGTPEYMSPEQVENKAIGPPSDIYSLGVVVYEMLAGKAPFTGTTPHVLHAHVYEEPPNIGSLRRELPAPVEGIVKKALAKDPRQRYRTAGEMARAMAQAARAKIHEPPTLMAEAVTAPARPRGLPMWAIAGGGAGAIILVLSIWALLGRSPGPPSVAVMPSPTLTGIAPVSAAKTATPTSTARPPADTLAPQGRVTYTVQEGDTLFTISQRFGVTMDAIAQANDLASPYFLVRTGQALIIPVPSPTPTATTTAIPTSTPLATATLLPATPTPIPVTPTPEPTPTAASEGKIAYLLNNELHVMNRDGSGQTRIDTTVGYWGLFTGQVFAWAPDGQRIAYVPSYRSPWRYNYVVADPDGTNASTITKLGSYAGISWSPDGSRVALEKTGNDSVPRIYLVDVASGQESLIATGAYMPVWSPSADSIFYYTFHPIKISWACEKQDRPAVMNRDGSQAFELRGDQLDYDCKDATLPAWSPDGTRLALYSPRRNDHSPIHIVAADGTQDYEIPLDNSPPPWNFPVFTLSWSPDGNRIAFMSNRTGNWEIWAMNSDGSGQVNLTNHTAEDAQPSWSPDGKKIAFSSYRDGHWEIYVMNADGSNQTRLTHTEGNAVLPVWAPR